MANLKGSEKERFVLGFQVSRVDDRLCWTQLIDMNFAIFNHISVPITIVLPLSFTDVFNFFAVLIPTV